MGIIRSYLEKVEDLFIEVYLIGYSNEGESILFLIKNKEPDGNIIFSGAIDCYEEKGVNKTIELIQQFKINKLDFFCWTHPDIDHSLGMDKIFRKYTDKSTKIVVPESMFDLACKLSAATKCLCDDMGKKVIKMRSQMYDIVPAQAGMTLIELSIGSGLRLHPYKFCIKSIAPFYNLILSQSENKKLKNNTFCIALLFEFEGINLLFTSDIEERTIKNFRGNISLPDKIHYIKIPHHGSSKSELFLQFLKDCGIDNTCISCSTAFYNLSLKVPIALPDMQLLKKYKNISKKIFCTNSKIKTNIDGKNGNGTFAVKIDIINKTIACKCFDDAIEI